MSDTALHRAGRALSHPAAVLGLRALVFGAFAAGLAVVHDVAGPAEADLARSAVPAVYSDSGKIIDRAETAASGAVHVLPGAARPLPTDLAATFAPGSVGRWTAVPVFAAATAALPASLPEARLTAETPVPRKITAPAKPDGLALLPPRRPDDLAVASTNAAAPLPLVAVAETSSAAEGGLFGLAARVTRPVVSSGTWLVNSATALGGSAAALMR